MTKTKTIPKSPSFYGPGWMEKLEEWTAKNLPSDFSANWKDEASIRANMVGGSPSSHFCSELRRAVEAYNSGEEYDTPRCEWNAQQIAERAMIRERM